METRALAIAFFFAIGTAVGGITGPLRFGKLIATGEKNQVAIGFFIAVGAEAGGGEELAAEDVGRDEDSARRAAPERIRTRTARRHQRERSGLRRYRPGPGVFRETLREATADGDIRRTSPNTYAPADDDESAKQQPTASEGSPPTG